MTCPRCESILTYAVSLLGAVKYRCYDCGHVFDDDELECE
jgi:transposase-like protein